MKKSLPRIYLKIFAVAVVLALLLGSFAYWTNLYRPSFLQLSRIIQTGKSQPEPEIGLSFEIQPAATGSQTVEVIIDGRDQEIWGADLRIGFDTQLAKIKEVEVGNYFEEPLVLDNQVRGEEGEVWFSVGSLSAGQGSGVIATLVVEPLEDKEPVVWFLPATQVAIRGKRVPAVIDYGN